MPAIVDNDCIVHCHTFIVYVHDHETSSSLTHTPLSSTLSCSDPSPCSDAVTNVLILQVLGSWIAQGSVVLNAVFYQARLLLLSSAGLHRH